MARNNNEAKQGERRSAVSGLSRWLWIGLVLVAGVAAVLSFVVVMQRGSPSPAVPAPLTSFEGSEADPALSPDGERLAFVWDGGTGGPFEVYVLDIETKEPIALTSGLQSASHPAWSPNGRDIVFIRELEAGDSEVVAVEARGGSERILTSLTDVHFAGVDWAPDGQYLALVDKGQPHESESIFLFSIEEETKRKLTAPPTAGSGDRNPVFSGDGRYLAFVRWWEGNRNEIYVLDLEEGRQRLVASFDGQIRGLDWLADDSTLVFSAQWRGTLGLWRLPIEHGEPTRLNYGENASGVSVSRHLGRLAFSQRHRDSNIWRVSGPGAREPSPPNRFIGSTRQDWGPRYSPDGGKLALTSDRSGEIQIWTCHSDGTKCSQLTPRGANATGAYWSPGGESIVFTEMSQGNAEVYVIDVNVGIPFRLTREASSDLAGCWSSDGEWIYFSSDRTDRYEIWRVPASGGDAEQVTYNGGILPVVSPDDRFVYYLKLTSPRSIWRLSLESHIERLICEADVGVTGFSLWRNLIVYLLQDNVEGARAEAFDMETRETTLVAELGLETRFGGYGRHSVSPDGQWILFSREDGAGSDIMLVEAFQ